MARFNHDDGRDTTATYQAAEIFRDRCLMVDGSLLFDDSPVWTLANLDRLHEKFVDSPDESDRSFEEKFKDQIKDEGPQVIRLAAEVLAIYFLFPSSVSAGRKRELIGEVLGWGGDTLPEGHLVWRAFAGGIGSGGQGFNTRRRYELYFLIRLAIAWKKLGHDQARERLQDPWVFQDFLNGVEDAEGRQLRHMLLHLLFPDHFERIASDGHKRRVSQVFAGLLKEPPEGTDRRLHAIRDELDRLLPSQHLDFYRPPLAEAWYDSAGDIEVIHHKKQVVLYGPPGTSKTHRAINLAERIIRSAALQRLRPARYFQE